MSAITCFLWEALYIFYSARPLRLGLFKNFLAEADEGKGIKFPAWARVYVSYGIPIIVLVIFVQGYCSKFAPMFMN